MKPNLLVVILLCGALCACQNALAQKKPGTTPPQKNFALFFEKVYVHTDRDYYATGEDMWFKAYLVNGLSNYPTYSSNNLYVELVSPEAKIMSREILRLDNGMGMGDFKLTDSIPEGTYHLRAYTNWMRNFGDNFIFDKQIIIHSVPGVKPANPRVKGTGKRAKSTEVEAVNIAETYKINFFPEGGALIDGVASIVGFKAEDALGRGIKVSGDVTSAQGDIVAHFESTELGLGTFTMLPVAGSQYIVKGVYKNNQPFNAELPAVLREGYAIHINNSDSANVQVILSTNQATLDKSKGKMLTLASKHADKFQFEAKFPLGDLQMRASIPKAKLSAGVNSIILYDELLHPNCERLVFVNRDNIKLSIVPDKYNYAPKEKTTVTITATDNKNQPVKGEFSMAVVDGTVVPADESNIAAYLLLQSDIRGRIENAAQYFDMSNTNRFKQIDILLLTQGWRDFVWKRLQDSTLKLSYLPEAGFTVSGRLRSVLINKPIPNGNITLYAPGAKGNKFFVAQTDQNGKYYLDGIELYGSQTLRLVSTDMKGKKTGLLTLDTLASDALAVASTPIFNEDASPQLEAFNKASSQRVADANRFKVSNVVQLKQVNINDKGKTVSLYEETLQSFGYPEYDYNIDASYAKKYKDLEDFLIRTIPGCQTNPDSADGVMFLFGGKKIFPRFIVDKQEDLFERIDYYGLTMDQVISVSERHMISMGGGDRILIYLSLKPSAFQKKEFNLVNEDVEGYYNARTFYAPNYEYSSTKSDQRTTIHWEPMISTDEKGQATVSFYNADPKSKIRVVVQGLSEKGVPLSAVTSYNIK